MSSKIIRTGGEGSKNIAPYNFRKTTMLEDPPTVTTPGLETPSRVPDLPIEAGETGSATIAAAEQQAELLLRQAQGRAAEIEKEAYEKGFTEGEKAGREVGEKMVEAQLKQYSKSVEELNGLRREIFASSEREVIRLSLEIAKKVVKREIVIDEELILTLVRVALNRLAEQTVVTVRVNPKDYSFIQRHQSAHSAKASLNEGVTLIEDPTISRGGCLIETESGIIDARIEEQFREIAKGFFE